MLFKVREVKLDGKTFDFSHYHSQRSSRQKGAKMRKSGPVVCKLTSIKSVSKAVTEPVESVAPISAMI